MPHTPTDPDSFLPLPTVAEELIGWMQDTGVDGFNLKYIISLRDMTAFVDLVIPELQSRAIYKTHYEEGSFREKLYGRGQCHLPSGHPGAAYKARAASVLS